MQVQGRVVVYILFLGMVNGMAIGCVRGRAVRKADGRFCPLYRSKREVMVKALSEEGGIKESQAVMLWDEYRKSGYGSFIRFLIAVNPYQKTDRVYIRWMKLTKAQSKVLKGRGKDWQPEPKTIIWKVIKKEERVTGE